MSVKEAPALDEYESFQVQYLTYIREVCEKSVLIGVQTEQGIKGAEWLYFS
jgi:hypothetical protein